MGTEYSGQFSHNNNIQWLKGHIHLLSLTSFHVFAALSLALVEGWRWIMVKVLCLRYVLLSCWRRTEI